MAAYDITVQPERDGRWHVFTNGWSCGSTFAERESAVFVANAIFYTLCHEGDDVSLFTESDPISEAASQLDPSQFDDDPDKVIPVGVIWPAWPTDAEPQGWSFVEADQSGIYTSHVAAAQAMIAAGIGTSWYHFNLDTGEICANAPTNGAVVINHSVPEL